MLRRRYERKMGFLLRLHDAEGLRRFGKRRWYEANVGWFVDYVEGSISSKVYGSPAEVLVSILTKDGRSAQHSVREY